MNSTSPSQTALRCAVFVPPHLGGIFTFYRRFHKCAPDAVFSVELEGERESWRDYAPELAGPEHRCLDLQGLQGPAASKALINWLKAQQVELIVLTPMSADIVFETLPYLPKPIRALVRLTEISDYSYARALRNAGFVDGIIVQCPRQRSDIAHLEPEIPRFYLPNGVDISRFSALPSVAPNAELRLLVLDRLTHTQKRILLLPDLCRALDVAKIAYRLTVGGTGVDEANLRTGLTPWIKTGQAQMLGRVAPDNVPALMSEHDVYLKLSRNEGSPNAVLEAMAAQLLPIAMDLTGVTDHVIQNGRTGFLVPVDDISELAKTISHLAAAPEVLSRMRHVARTETAKRFSMEKFNARALQIMRDLPEQSSRKTLDWTEWRSLVPRSSRLRRMLRRLVPLEWRQNFREARAARKRKS